MGSKVRPGFSEVISSTEPFAMDPDSTKTLRVTCCGSPDKRWQSGGQSKQLKKLPVYGFYLISSSACVSRGRHYLLIQITKVFLA